jgi:hypothetical protein
MPKTETRNQKLDLRLTPSAKRAPRLPRIAAHRSVSEFVLRAPLVCFACPDCRRFRLSAEVEAFQAALLPHPGRLPADRF